MCVSRLTGQEFTYDGNPHRFGDQHPRFTSYKQPIEIISPVITSSDLAAASDLSEFSHDLSDLRLPVSQYDHHQHALKIDNGGPQHTDPLRNMMTDGNIRQEQNLHASMYTHSIPLHTTIRSDLKSFKFDMASFLVAFDSAIKESNEPSQIALYNSYF